MTISHAEGILNIHATSAYEADRRHQAFSQPERVPLFTDTPPINAHTQIQV